MLAGLETTYACGLHSRIGQRRRGTCDGRMRHRNFPLGAMVEATALPAHVSTEQYVPAARSSCCIGTEAPETSHPRRGPKRQADS